MSDIRELVENAMNDAATLGTWIGHIGKPGRQAASNSYETSRAALLAAIERLEQKAATAKAECEAWRAWEAAYEETISVPPEEQHKAYEQVGVAERAITTARAATDEAWREQAQEPKP